MNTLEFTINSKILATHVKLVNSVVTHNPIVPILENLLFKISPVDTSLTLLSSDLHTTLMCDLRLLVCSLPNTYIEFISFCINAKKLYKLLSKLPEQDIKIQFDGDSKVTVQYEKGMANFFSENAIDYPKIPALTNPSQITTNAVTFRNALIPCLASVSTDDLRPAMTGVYFDGTLNEKTYSLVSTDGHRLTSVVDGVMWGAKHNFIVPAKALRSFVAATKRYEANVQIDVVPFDGIPGSSQLDKKPSPLGYVSFKWANCTLISRLIDERFPDYATAVPTDFTFNVIVNRKGLIALIERVEVFANPITHHLKLRVEENKVLLSCDNVDSGIIDDDVTEEMNATTKTFAPVVPLNKKNPVNSSNNWHGYPFEIGFNARIWVEQLKVMPETHVQLLMSAPNRAVVMHPHSGEPVADFTALVMPVMLNTYA